MNRWRVLFGIFTLAILVLAVFKFSSRDISEDASRVETAVLDLNDQGLINGQVHIRIGQEAIAADMAGAVEKADLVGSTHRVHGHFLAKPLMCHAPEGLYPL